MTKPWTLTTPDGLPPALEQAWEAMRARCLKADAMERTLRDADRMIARGDCILHFADSRLYDMPTFALAVAAWARANPEVPR